jgi:hypothetical protein
MLAIFVFMVTYPVGLIVLKREVSRLFLCLSVSFILEAVGLAGNKGICVFLFFFMFGSRALAWFIFFLIDLMENY